MVTRIVTVKKYNSEVDNEQLFNINLRSEKDVYMITLNREEAVRLQQQLKIKLKIKK